MLASDDVRIVVHERLPDAAAIDAAGDAYLATFSQPPYRETETDRAGFIDRVRRYSARPGFRLGLALDGGQVVGLGLAVIGRPGDWWRDQVASRIGTEDTARWLGSACLELVHLAVVPGRQGEGIGGRLHDRLIEGAAVPTAILSVHPAAEPARALYANRGWRPLRDPLPMGDGPPPALLVRDLGEISSRT